MLKRWRVVVAGLAMVLAGACAPAQTGATVPGLEGSAQDVLMVTSAGPQVVQCPPGGGCPNKVLKIDARKMPFIAQNIEAAIDEGIANVLSKGAPGEDRARRAVACRGFRPAFGGTCDEFPFASSQQGGLGARVAEVPGREQSCQGGTISRFYQTNNIQTGQGFLVNVINKDAIPTGPYAGGDPALDKGVC